MKILKSRAVSRHTTNRALYSKVEEPLYVTAKKIHDLYPLGQNTLTNLENATVKSLHLMFVLSIGNHRIRAKDSNPIRKAIEE